MAQMSQNVPTHHMTLVTVTSTAQVISAARKGRTLIIQNQGADIVRVGGPTISASLGFSLDPASSRIFVDDGTGAEWWAICPTSSIVFIDDIY